ncbi:MAG: hypothetical protein AMXMBFR64_12740 [Myxococcales bacterium]
MSASTVIRSPALGLLALFFLACDPKPPSEAGFGHSFAVVPDIDGDGVEDIIAAIPLHSFSRDRRTRVNAGGLCVISGQTGVTRSCHYGANGGAFLGSSIISLATPTGPGRLVACAPGERARGGEWKGVCHIIDAEWFTEVGAVQFASSLAHSLGDISGDGFEDFGLRSPDRQRWAAVSGANGEVLWEIALQKNSEYAHILTGLLLDIDGDQLSEAVATTYNRDTDSFSLSIHSGASGSKVSSCSPSHMTHFGFSLATVVPVANSDMTQSPRVVVGSVDKAESIDVSLVLLDPTTCEILRMGDALLPPSTETGSITETISVLDDVNGDGVNDLARTSTCYNGCTGSRVDVISGKTLSSLQTQESEFDGTRRQIAVAPDYNRDGVPDFIWNAKSGERDVLQIIDGATLDVLLERGFDDQNWRWRDQ